MPDAAKVWVMFHVREVVESIPKTESVKVDGIEVQRVPDHSSRVPWLWEATCTVSVAQKNDNPRKVATHFSMAWRIFFQLTPEMKGGECWREATDMRFGRRSARTSKCRNGAPEFSSFIRSMWESPFREWDDEMAKRGVSNEDRAAYLGDLKSRKAREFGLRRTSSRRSSKRPTDRGLDTNPAKRMKKSPRNGSLRGGLAWRSGFRGGSASPADQVIASGRGWPYPSSQSVPTTTQQTCPMRHRAGD